MPDPRELKTRPPFSEVFAVNDSTLDAITFSIRERGFMPSRPIEVWRQEGVIVDGHTRRLAAVAAGLTDVPVCYLDFKDEDDAFDYAVGCHVKQRQLTDAEIYRVTKELDRRKTRGGDHKSDEAKSKASCDALIPTSGKTAVETAEKIGTSARKIESARAVADAATEFPEIEQEVLRGGKSIRMAAREVADRKRKAKQQKAGAPAYTPVVLPRSDAPPPPEHPPARSDADAEWLESFPVRAQLTSPACRSMFDADALIHREFSPVINPIKAGVQALVGGRMPERSGPLYRAIFKLSPVSPVRSWYVCHECKGSGQGGKNPSNEFRCRKCSGCGYIIPSF